MTTRATESAFAKALIPMKAANPIATASGPNLPSQGSPTAKPPAGMPQKTGVVPPPVLGPTAKPGKVAKRAADSPFAKAYTKGEITIAQENANIHRRKKTSADRRLGAGTAAAGLGIAAAANSKTIGQGVTQGLHDLGATPGGRHPLEVGQRAARVARRGGVGLAVGGGLVAAGSLAQRGHHARQQNRHTKVAQDARRRRMAQEEQRAIGKRAGDSVFAKGLVGDLAGEAQAGVKREVGTVRAGTTQVTRRARQGLRQIGAGAAL